MTKTTAEESAPPRPAVRRPAVPRFVAGNVLHLILMPTEKCNFRCTYCYEDFEHGRMQRPTIDGVLNLLANRVPALDSLAIEWFGGEPLLALPIVEEIQTHVGELARGRSDLRRHASMTTNGYLLGRDDLTRLFRLGVTSYQISIDGPASAHDRHRRRADGAGTFERIYSNLLAARDSDLDFQVLLRIHVDRENQAELPGFLELLGRDLKDDERFEVFLRPVSRLGGANDAAIPVLEGREVDLVEELRRRARELGLRLSRPPGPCYAAAANSFVIRSTGEIAKCTVALNHPKNRVGRLRSDGTAKIDNDLLNGWLRGLFSGEEEELQCPMKGFADPRTAAGGLRVLAAQ